MNREEEYKKLKDYKKKETIRKTMNFFPDMTLDEKDELLIRVEKSSEEFGKFVDYLSNKYILNRDTIRKEKKGRFHFDLNYDDDQSKE